MPWGETHIEKILIKTDTSGLLKSFCNTALKNSNTISKHAYRYNESLNNFCIFFYFVGGR